MMGEKSGHESRGKGEGGERGGGGGGGGGERMNQKPLERRDEAKPRRTPSAVPHPTATPLIFLTNRRQTRTSSSLFNIIFAVVSLWK